MWDVGCGPRFRYQQLKATLTSGGGSIEQLYEAGQLAYALAGSAKYPLQQLQLAKEAQRYLTQAMELDSLREDVVVLLTEVTQYLYTVDERLELERGLRTRPGAAAEAASVHTLDSLTGSLITPAQKAMRRETDKRLLRRIPATLEEDPAKVIVQQLSRRIMAEGYRRDYFAVMNATLQSAFAAAQIIETGAVKTSGSNVETAARTLGHFVSFIPGAAAVTEGAGKALAAAKRLRERNGHQRILQMIPDRVAVEERLSALSRLFTVAAEPQLSRTDPALQKSAIGKKFAALRARLKVERINNGYQALAKEHAMSLIALVMEGKVSSAVFLSAAVVPQILVGVSVAGLLDEVAALTGQSRDTLTPTLLSLYPVGSAVPAQPAAAASAAPAGFFSGAAAAGSRVAITRPAKQPPRPPDKQCVLQ